MKVLVIDQDKCGLAFSMRAQEAGHKVELWMPPEKGTGKKCPIGEGLVPRITNFKPSMTRADLIVVTENSRYGGDLEPFFKAGYPIFGCNLASAQLELDRGVGQEVLKKYTKVLDYKVFSSYDKGIAYVKAEGKPFVSKPWGGDSDKSRSYVPKRADDLVARLENWKALKLKGDFMLQEMVDGFEMAVGAWFGPGGWSSWINENWEEKRLMAGALGPNTGEMGTSMRYVKKSKLFKEVLEPAGDILKKLGYVGYVDMNCIVDTEGTPWPLEFTMRFGWPHFNLCMELHQGDPVEWMADLLEGRDSLKVSEDICVGVVMALGSFPLNDPPEEVEGWAIHGLTSKTLPHVYLQHAMMGVAPIEDSGKIKPTEVICTAGNYALVACGTGATVRKAAKGAYKVVEDIGWAPHKIYRVDISQHLEDDLPCLQDFGYAEGMVY